MKYTKVIIPFLAVIITASCNKHEGESTQHPEAHKITLDTLKISTPENLKPTIPLVPKATAALENWSLYNELAAAIDNIDATTLSDLRVQLESFNTIYEVSEQADEAEVSITPKEVNTNAINARLLAVKTRIDALQNEADLNNPNASQLSLKIGELKNAYQDLNLQLNEIYNTSVKDLLDEIKAENKKDQIDNTPAAALDNTEAFK